MATASSSIVALLVVGCGQPAAQSPNIVFIFADDWGWGDLGVHGSDTLHTPNIDRLAREGTDFHQFTVNSPVCSPSRAALMTGQFPERFGIDRHFANIEHHQRAGMPDWLDTGAPSLARMLRDTGYSTAHFGKWHLTNIWIEDAPHPDQYGFDEYAAFNLPGKNMPPRETADRAVDFIRRHGDRPFFLNVWLHETHTPHYPDEDVLEKYGHLDAPEQVYAAVVEAGDRDVGRILAAIGELGLEENTVVIFSSDNGPESPNDVKSMDDLATGPGFGRYYSVGSAGGMKGRKRSLYSGGVRVPFIVRWPGVVPENAVDTTSVITAVDLLPTFLDIAGGMHPAAYSSDGESAIAALRGNRFRRSKPIYWVWPASDRGAGVDTPNWPQFGFQKDGWKLLTNPHLERTELYRVREDWYEANDLSDQHPDMTARLLAEMNDLRSGFPDAPPEAALSRLRERDTADLPVR
ncbi:MAG: sulfatase-like hydrolase/transferase [Pseudomonadota bacterium]